MKKYLSGNEAVALAALECGTSVITGYPGTPSSEAIGSIWNKKVDGVEIQWSVNEKVALEIACAAAWAGKASLCTMKMNGVNVAYDSLIGFMYSGCLGAMVLYVCDDPGVSSGMPEQDMRGFAKMSDMPIIEPTSVADSYSLTRFAFMLSHEIQSPVMLRSVTNVALSHAIIDTDDVPMPIFDKYAEPAFTRDITKYTKAGSKICMDQHNALINRCSAAIPIIHNNGINKLSLGNKGGIGIIAAGVASKFIDEAMQLIFDASGDKIDFSLLTIRTSFPAPTQEIEQILMNCSKVLVVEENEPYVEDAAIIVAHSANVNVSIHGKNDGCFSRVGSFNALTIAKAVAKVLGKKVTFSDENISNCEDLCAKRPIGVCAGCPHRGVFMSINNAVRHLGYKKDDVIVTGDIGCTILGMSQPFNTVWTEVAMGASIPIAQGFYHSGVKTPIIATIGDSTFMHAGIPGLINAVQNNIDMTLIIMDNGWTAMTGMQVNAGTAEEFQQNGGKNSVDIAKLIAAFDLGSFEIVDPYDTKTTQSAIESAMKTSGVSVILARRECAINAGRRKIKYGQIHIDADKCTKCKVCVMTTGCPALSFIDNGITVDKKQCNGCGICVNVCPQSAIIKE